MCYRNESIAPDSYKLGNSSHREREAPASAPKRAVSDPVDLPTMLSIR
jgi:hypothetical protein